MIYWVPALCRSNNIGVSSLVCTNFSSDKINVELSKLWIVPFTDKHQHFFKELFNWCDVILCFEKCLINVLKTCTLVSGFFLILMCCRLLEHVMIPRAWWFCPSIYLMDHSTMCYMKDQVNYKHEDLKYIYLMFFSIYQTVSLFYFCFYIHCLWLYK